MHALDAMLLKPNSTHVLVKINLTFPCTIWYSLTFIPFYCFYHIDQIRCHISCFRLGHVTLVTTKLVPYRLVLSQQLIWRWGTSRSHLLRPGPWWLNIKMSSCQYRKSYCGDKTILLPSYLHNGISDTGRMTSSYWIGALALDSKRVDRDDRVSGQ